MRLSSVPAVAAALVLALTGCAPAAPTSRAALPPQLPAVVPPAPQRVEPVDPPTGESAPTDDELPDLLAIWLGPDPRGTGPQVALRFMKALQRHDDLAADRELHHFDRFLFEEGDLALLHRAMDDVRRNAGLAHAGPCTAAARVADEVAVVTCGALHVVVHVVATRHVRGVQINELHARKDVYRGSHTHAFTSLWK